MNHCITPADRQLLDRLAAYFEQLDASSQVFDRLSELVEFVNSLPQVKHGGGDRAVGVGKPRQRVAEAPVSGRRSAHFVAARDDVAKLLEQLVALDLIHESSSCCDQGAPTPDDHSVGGKDGAGAVFLPAAPADPSDGGRMGRLPSAPRPTQES